MATFTYLPDWGASPELEPGVRSVRFGDGYEQRATNGLNPILPLWKLQFTRRTQVQAQAIYSWMIANNAQVTAFDWAAPGEGVAAGELFGTGDGARVAWSIVALSRPCTVVGTPTIYRSDWQGTQQLYSTPRTNRWLQSAALGTSPNVQNGVTSTSAAGIAPDGTNTAFKVAEDGGNTIHCLQQSITVGAEQVNQSFWVKAAERTKCAISPAAGDGIYCHVDLAAGAITAINGTATAVIKDAGNGWWKVSVTYTATAGTKSARLYVATVANSVAAYQGVAGNGILVWHPQNETGPVATSDIPTAAAAVTVTDYTLGASGLVTLATAPLLNASMTWTGAYTRKHVAKFGVPKPDAYNSWSISAEFREVPA